MNRTNAIFVNLSNFLRNVHLSFETIDETWNNVCAAHILGEVRCKRPERAQEDDPINGKNLYVCVQVHEMFTWI